MAIGTFEDYDFGSVEERVEVIKSLRLQWQQQHGFWKAETFASRSKIISICSSGHQASRIFAAPQGLELPA